MSTFIRNYFNADVAKVDGAAAKGGAADVPTEGKKVCKACTACVDLKKTMDKCVSEKGAENCTEQIKQHDDCKAKYK